MCRPELRRLGDAVPARILVHMLPELRGACSRPTHHSTAAQQECYNGEIIESPTNIDNDLNTRVLFDNEAENTFLLKISYWFPI